MDYKDLLDALKKLQESVDKDLSEIRKQKSDIQNLKEQLFDQIDNCNYIRDKQRLVLSAPEIIIGNVDKSGKMIGNGIVIVKGSDVGVQAVGEVGSVTIKAPLITQLAVDPGIDGQEEVVRGTSAIISQAKGITLQSNDAATDGYFSQTAISPGNGVKIHADQSIEIDATNSTENKINEVDAIVEELEDNKKELTANSKDLISNIKSLLDQLDQAEKLQTPLGVDETAYRSSVLAFDMINDIFDSIMPALYNSFNEAYDSLAALAETNRRIKALKEEKGATEKLKGDFKEKATGASISVNGEIISFNSVDGDGNIRTNPASIFSVQARNLFFTSHNADGTLIKDSNLYLNTQDVTLSTVNSNIKNDGSGGELNTVGSVSILSKNVQAQAKEFTVDKDGKLEFKEMTPESTFNVQTLNTTFEAEDKDKNTVGEFNVKTEKTDFRSMDKDDNVTGTFSLRAKEMQALAQDKDMNSDGTLTLKAKNIAAVATDKDGKATGQVMLDGKEIYLKATDIDAQKGSDTALTAGGQMVMLAEKMFIGRADSNEQSKEITISADKTGMYGKTTAEVQQGEGKATLQLDGGNASIGGSATKIFGDTTINAKTDIKGDVSAPKVEAKNLVASSSFKSPNIKDGMGMGGAGGGGGSLSAKLKENDAPKQQDIAMPKKEEKKEEEK